MAQIKSSNSTSKTTATTKKEKLISIKFVSAKTENVILLGFLADTFSRAIFKCEAKEVSANQPVKRKDGSTTTAKEVIEELLSNDAVKCIVTDLSIDKFAGITLDEY
jgi:hypothetical protein